MFWFPPVCALFGFFAFFCLDGCGNKAKRLRRERGDAGGLIRNHNVL